MADIPLMKLLSSIAIALCLNSAAATYYVSTNGSGVVGSFASPMGLSNALKTGVSPAVSGDTIYVRGGTYVGTFTCTLSATNDPITVRNFNNERAIIDCANPTNDVWLIEGSGVWMWGLEVINSNTNRYTDRGVGVSFNTSAAGANNKLINCIVHDTGNAIFVSYQSTNAEVTGCVIYNNGYQLSDRGHGHDLYVQNRDANISKLFQHNMGFNDFYVGINCRSSFETRNMIFLRNLEVSSGSTSTNGLVANFHTEGDPLVDQIIFDGNFSYYPNQIYGQTFYSLSTNGTISVSNNVWANSYSQIFNWTNVIFNNNTQAVNLDIRADNTNYTTADFNQYYSVALSVPISYKTTNYTLANWQALFHNDSNGTSTASAPAGNWIYVLPNPYEQGRSHVIVYNWLTNDTVSVDASSVLRAGNTYEVRHAADYNGALVASGTYGGGNLTLPMTNISAAIPTGMLVAPTNTAPKFAAFVVSQTSFLSILNTGTLIKR